MPRPAVPRCPCKKTTVPSGLTKCSLCSKDLIWDANNVPHFADSEPLSDYTATPSTPMPENAQRWDPTTTARQRPSYLPPGHRTSPAQPAAPQAPAPQAPPTWNMPPQAPPPWGAPHGTAPQNASEVTPPQPNRKRKFIIAMAVGLVAVAGNAALRLPTIEADDKADFSHAANSLQPGSRSDTSADKKTTSSNDPAASLGSDTPIEGEDDATAVPVKGFDGEEWQNITSVESQFSVWSPHTLVATKFPPANGISGGAVYTGGVLLYRKDQLAVNVERGDYSSLLADGIDGSTLLDRTADFYRETSDGNITDVTSKYRLTAPGTRVYQYAVGEKVNVSAIWLGPRWLTAVTAFHLVSSSVQEAPSVEEFQFVLDHFVDNSAPATPPAG